MANGDYDGPERRGSPGRRVEDVVGWRLAQLENEVQALERRADHAVTGEQLREIFIGRDAILAREFVPRAELDAKRDWTLRLYGFILIAGQAVEAFFLAHR